MTGGCSLSSRSGVGVGVSSGAGAGSAVGVGVTVGVGLGTGVGVQMVAGSPSGTVICSTIVRGAGSAWREMSSWPVRSSVIVVSATPLRVISTMECSSPSRG
ncbi:MAG: hypothetical protein DRI48_06090 [Chloroflexi bacterium]|nr:MAG: hypothetical protein DRI48_06090 [Chloroflexota bacterium]